MKKIVLTVLTAFFLPLPALAGQNIIINEVAWMGTAESANHEWLELYNPGENQTDLAGWRLEAADGSPKIPLSGLIPAGGFFLLERTGDETLPDIPADMIFTGSLSNAGEDLILYDPTGAVIDELDASAGWPGGDNTAKTTLERTENGGWQSSSDPGGTPKAENSDNSGSDLDDQDASLPAEPSVPQPAISNTPEGISLKKGEVVISELLPNPAGLPAEQEFIELRNISGKTVVLKNCRLVNAAKQSFALSQVGLAPGAIVTFYRSQTGLVLYNEKEKVTLYCDQDKIIDEAVIKTAAPIGLSWQINSDPQSGEKFCWEKPNPGGENICKTVILPNAMINGPWLGETFETLSFDASDSFDKLNRPLSFHWDFGDGRQAAGQKVYQEYFKPGTYEIRLSAITEGQASSTAIRKIKIKNPAATTPENTTSTGQIQAAKSLPPAAVINPDNWPNIFISEFLPDPAEAETENEFIELFSNEPRPFELGGFSLTDGSSKTKPYLIPAGTIIKPGQYLAFYRNQTKIALNNDGDVVKFISPNGVILDQAEYQKSKTGLSWVLDENFVWRQSKTPSPGEINVLDQPAQNSLVSSTPQVLGTSTNNTEAGVTGKKEEDTGKSTTRYLFSMVSAVLAIGAGVAYKIVKK